MLPNSLSPEQLEHTRHLDRITPRNVARLQHHLQPDANLFVGAQHLGVKLLYVIQVAIVRHVKFEVFARLEPAISPTSPNMHLLLDAEAVRVRISYRGARGRRKTSVSQEES